MENFEIRYNLICSDFYKTAYWRETPCAIQMAKNVREKWKNVKDLYIDFINNPNCDWHLQQEYFVGEISNQVRTPMDVISSNDIKAMRETLQCDLYIDPNNFYWIQPHTYVGLNLYIEETIKLNDPLFITAFAFRFSKSNLRISFLDYHFFNTFDSDWRKYSLLIQEVIEKHVNKDEANYLKKYLENSPLVPVKRDQVNESGVEVVTFQSAFKRPELFEDIIKLLSTPENGKYFSNDGQWIKSASNVSDAITLIDVLILRKYFKEEIKFSNETKIKFCFEWFGVTVGANSSNLRGSGSRPEFIRLATIIKMAQP